MKAWICCLMLVVILWRAMASTYCRLLALVTWMSLPPAESGYVAVTKTVVVTATTAVVTAKTGSSGCELAGCES